MANVTLNITIINIGDLNETVEPVAAPAENTTVETKPFKTRVICTERGLRRAYRFLRFNATEDLVDDLNFLEALRLLNK